MLQSRSTSGSLRGNQMLSGLFTVLCWLAEKRELEPSSPASHPGLLLSRWTGRVTVYAEKEAKPQRGRTPLSSGPFQLPESMIIYHHCISSLFVFSFCFLDYYLKGFIVRSGGSQKINKRRKEITVMGSQMARKHSNISYRKREIM